jgi:hypothetical protein
MKDGEGLFGGDFQSDDDPDPKISGEGEATSDSSGDSDSTEPKETKKPRRAQKSPPAIPPAKEASLIDGIDLEEIALDDKYAEGMGCNDGGVAAIAVRKPARDWFVRTHPTHSKSVRLLEIKDGPDRGFYIVHRSLWANCEKGDVLLRPVRLTLATSRESGLFLWPLKLQEKGFEGRTDDWSASALRIAKIAETNWVKVYTKPGAGCYSHKVAAGIRAEPIWPIEAFVDLVAIAFEGRVIKDKDDPFLRRILGEE